MALSKDTSGINNENVNTHSQNDKASSTINIQGSVIGRDKRTRTFHRTNEIAKVFYDLQSRINELAPNNIQPVAKSHLRELRRQLITNQPNLASIADCLKWFQTNTPQFSKHLCKTLNRLTYSISVRAILDAYCERDDRHKEELTDLTTE